MADELKVCSQCKGLRYREYEAGLIRLPCRACHGTGSQEVATILKGDEQYAEEYDSGAAASFRLSDSDGVGFVNRSADEEVASKPELPKKRKPRKKSKS